MMNIKRYPRESIRDEKGMILVVSLMMISALLLLGTTAVMTSTTDMKISANYKTGNQAYYAAAAGIEEARARMGTTFLPATSATGRIYDTDTTNPLWSVSICPTCTYTSIPSALSYTVRIEHQTSGGSVLYYGDSDNDGLNERTTTSGPKMRNIYLVTSTGSASGAQKTIAVEITRLPPITVPGPLYVEATTKIMGNSTSLIGTDGCGTDNKPGIVTTLDGSTITQSGGPTIVGSPQVAAGQNNMDVRSMVNTYKNMANYPYNYTSNQTQTGMNWGTPVAGASETAPSSCDDVSPPNIVYYNMNDTSSIKLSGGSSGCGILLVDGDLDVQGGFRWYGLVMVTGSVTFTGGGSEKKNITGGVIAGNEVDASLFDSNVAGGSISLVYCSAAINNLTENQPFKRLNWKEQGM